MFFSQVILVATSGDNMRGKASDALVHMINMVQSDNARFIIYVSERDSLNFRRGLPNNTQVRSLRCFSLGLICSHIFSLVAIASQRKTLTCHAKRGNRFFVSNISPDTVV